MNWVELHQTLINRWTAVCAAAVVKLLICHSSISAGHFNSLREKAECEDSEAVWTLSDSPLGADPLVWTSPTLCLSEAQMILTSF